MDDIFYELLWRPRWDRPVEPPPRVRVVEVQPETSWAETATEVSDAAEAECDRLAALVAGGLSPLEAAQKCFTEEGT